MTLEDIIIKYEVTTNRANEPVESQRWEFADGTVIRETWGDFYCEAVSENAIYAMEFGFIESRFASDGPNPYLLAIDAHGRSLAAVAYFEDGLAPAPKKNRPA